MKKNSLKFLLILAITSINVIAKDIQVNIDDAVFQDSTGTYRWELYYSFDEAGLKFVESTKGRKGEMFIDVTIKSAVKTEAEKKWIVTHYAEVSNTANKTLLGQKDFKLEAGQYKVNIFFQDVNDSMSSSELNFDLLIKAEKKSEIKLGGIEISQATPNIKDSQLQWNEAFIKGENFIVPNPSLIFNAVSQSLNSYLEIYNARIYGDNGITLKYLISDVYNNIIEENNKTLKPESDRIFDINSIPLMNVPSGVYYLRTVVLFPSDNPQDSISMRKKIFIMNPNLKSLQRPMFSESASFEKSEFSTLTQEQTEIEIAKIKPIAGTGYMEQFENLTSTEAKQRLLYRFWIQRDSDTNTAFNEELYKYRELIKFSNRYFSYGKTHGWHSDRGKILLKYGMPTQRDQHPYVGEQRAYESWFYAETQGGIYFYFVDITGYGNFELMHSTSIDEIKYEQWYEDYVLKQPNDRFDNSNKNKEY